MKSMFIQYRRIYTISMLSLTIKRRVYCYVTAVPICDSCDAMAKWDITAKSHVTNGGRWTFSKNVSSLALTTLSEKKTKTKKHMTNCMLLVTCDLWRVTPEMWHVTGDMWHMKLDRWGEVNLLSKFSAPQLLRFGTEGVSEIFPQSMNGWIS